MTWNAEKQKWERDEMPLDATDPDSLVGRMLGVGEVPPVLPEDGSSLPVLTEGVLNGEPLPLWRAMERASISRPGLNRNWLVRAAEIEAVRDFIVPKEPEPSPVDPADGAPTAKWLRWHERQRLRDLLTQQARIARGEQ
jgi:hypothetical protein